MKPKPKSKREFKGENSWLFEDSWESKRKPYHPFAKGEGILGGKQ